MASFIGQAEYAKTGRASCKSCKDKIPQGSLRLARMLKSFHFDGLAPNWYHYDCFFKKGGFGASESSQFEGFQSLRFDDQKKLAASLDAAGPPAVKSGGGKKAAAAAAAAPPLPPGCPPLKMEYAKSSRSACRSCQETIIKDELRLACMVVSEDRPQAGEIPRWFHRKCFAEGTKMEEFSGVPLGLIVPEHFEGFSAIKKEDLTDIRNLLDAARSAAGLSRPESGKRVADSKESCPVAKKAKTASETEIILKKQSDSVWKIRDKLKEVESGTIRTALELNGLPSNGGPDTIQARLADALVFGALQPCKVCSENKWDLKPDGYYCGGAADEWAMCTVRTQEPPVIKFRCSDALRDIPFFAKLKGTVVKRIFQTGLKPMKQPSTIRATNATQMVVDATSPAAVKDPQSQVGLKGIIIAIAGKLKQSAKSAKKLINELGGTFHTGTVGSSVTCLVTTQEEVTNNGSKVRDAIKFGVPIVSEAFLTECAAKKCCALLQPFLIMCSSTVIEPSQEEVRKEKRMAAKLEKSGSSSSKIITVKVHGRAVVDPKSKMDADCHVLDDKGTVWDASLSNVNLRDGQNSYYKLQIIVPNVAGSSRLFLFRSWGRLGTQIGGEKTETFYSRESCKAAFMEQFVEKTGNDWNDRMNFKKQAGMFNYVEIDYGYDDSNTIKSENDIKAGSKSTLAKEVKDLVSMLFDLKTLTNTMKEMDIDLSKLPLGRLSRKTLEDSNAVLSELQGVLGDISMTDEVRAAKISSCSSRFYGIIPHDTGMKMPPPLDSDTLLKEKVELIQSLIEIEFASRIIKASSLSDAGEDPIDANYKKLNTKLTVVEKGSKEFDQIQRYITNTHAATHQTYQLEVDAIFKVKRKGEAERYKPFKSLHNRRLLWHGSRLSNYVGILSQGLRIAPPEAPSTGYMFGKGLYFADMVSKSANYCMASQTAPSGLLLLSEVALGNMHECKAAEYIEKLPEGKHSCFGVGKTMPDKSCSEVSGSGVTVPLGKGVSSGVVDTSLLYNEFIVYDPAQVNIKYLIQTRFVFGQRRFF